MSNFACEHCGAICTDSPLGYVTGCEHYPPDVDAERLGQWREASRRRDGLAATWYASIDSMGGNDGH